MTNHSSPDSASNRGERHVFASPVPAEHLLPFEESQLEPRKIQSRTAGTWKRTVYLIPFGPTSFDETKFSNRTVLTIVLRAALPG